MTFEEIWPLAEIGDRLRVTNGAMEPSRRGSLRWKVWRSHNFEGVLVDKSDTATRCLCIELAPEAGAIVRYSVVEGMGHNFEVTS